MLGQHPPRLALAARTALRAGGSGPQLPQHLVRARAFYLRGSRTRLRGRPIGAAKQKCPHHRKLSGPEERACGAMRANAHGIRTSSARPPALALHARHGSSRVGSVRSCPRATLVSSTSLPTCMGLHSLLEIRKKSGGARGSYQARTQAAPPNEPRACGRGPCKTWWLKAQDGVATACPGLPPRAHTSFHALPRLDRHAQHLRVHVILKHRRRPHGEETTIPKSKTRARQPAVVWGELSAHRVAAKLKHLPTPETSPITRPPSTIATKARARSRARSLRRRRFVT